MTILSATLNVRVEASMNDQDMNAHQSLERKKQNMKSHFYRTSNKIEHTLLWN
jgi:hypothetical protein